VHYWTKRELDLERIFLSLISASGIRDIAREFRVTDKVILNRSARLGRQSMGIQASLLEPHGIHEDIAIDGFESFVWSQYFPNNFHIAVGADSQMAYTCDYAQLRRKGRMTDYQKHRRDELNTRYPIPAGEIEHSFSRCVSSILGVWSGNASGVREMRTDKKIEYRRVLAKLDEWRQGCAQHTARHLRVSSRKARTYTNPLMSVNYMDRELRKDQANHVRDTLQWSKSVNNAMDRMMIYFAYHNLWKQYRINESIDRVHAEVAGIPREEIERHKSRFFTKRYFWGHLVPDVCQMRTWFRLWKTPVSDLKYEARVMLCW
jgi:hypothetical protein